MLRFMKISLLTPLEVNGLLLRALTLMLTISLAGSVLAVCPLGDLDENCIVDWEDLRIFARQWLDPLGSCSDPNCADLDGFNGVNMSDFALLAKNWYQIGTPLVINEFMASNNSCIQDLCNDYDDWIEIYNASGDAIDIGGMYFTDDLSKPTRWQVPDNNPSATTIPSHGYLLIWADNEPNEGTLHANFKLSAGGEQIGLFETDGSTLIDSISFGTQTTDISYGRYPDANDNWIFMGVPTPEEENNSGYLGEVADTKFSHDRGFYEAPFSVTITCTTDGATIRYTLDGSEPSISNGSTYSTPISISGTACLRAAAFKTEWKETNIDTHSYIFLADVIIQSSSPGGGWPTGYVNEQRFNYGMDPEVVNPVGQETMIEVMKSVPTISLVTELGNLVDENYGIYVNAEQRGADWERPTSVELLNPDGSEGFQVEAGLRIRGGGSRWGENPKHSLRLFFRSVYGDASLKFPLFGDEGADEFQKVDLRTSQDYSWAAAGSSWNTMCRDVFARDTQRDMGQLYTRSRYYHLYINGLYWGLYQTQERSDARYAETYLGGSSDDYDTVKIDEHKYIKATDGNLDAWQQLYDFAKPAFGGDWPLADDATYYRLQGLDPNGIARNPSYNVLVDIDNFIDYMICSHYMGDSDGSGGVDWGDDMKGIYPHNFYGIYNRENPDGFKCFRHDAEMSMGTNGSAVDYTGPAPVKSSGSDQIDTKWWNDHFEFFVPQWLHDQLTAHPEYRMRFADRVHKHYFNGGALTSGKAEARFLARAGQIEDAIIAESARWGDATIDWGTPGTPSTPPKTKAGDWQPAVDWVVDNFISVRTSISFNQFKNNGWYPNINAPDFRIGGVLQHGGYVTSGAALTMDNPNGSGTIWYTLDGTDPRELLTGNPVGTPYTAAFALSESVHIKARVLNGGEWSALSEATFAVGPVADNLRITEMMYHPQDTGDPNNDPNAEFIELKNIGPETINLSLVRFTDGIDFTFPSRELTSDEYVLLVKDQALFDLRYPSVPLSPERILGPYEGRLANGGERICLEDAIGQTILDFEYRDGWRPITDGDGFSLTIIDPTNADPNSWGEKDSWRASDYIGGSPGDDDPGVLPNPGSVVINEVMAHSHQTADWIELHNTTGASINIGGWFLSDNDANLMKYRIANNTWLPAGEYIMFYEDQHFNNPGDPCCIVPFKFSENGEVACMSSADGNGLTGYREVEDFGASETGISFGRYFKSSTGNFNFVAMDHNTPGWANAPPKVGPIVINEIMYHPDWPDGGSYNNDDYEYIELHNITGSPVTLYRDAKGEPWKFTDGIDFTFPASPNEVTIPAGEYLLVVKNPAAFMWRYPSVPVEKILGPYDGRLNNAGERVELSMPGDVDQFGTHYYIRIDRVNYSDGSHPEDCPGGVDLWPTEADGGGKSLTRINSNLYGNDVINWDANDPTPGTSTP